VIVGRTDRIRSAIVRIVSAAALCCVAAGTAVAQERETGPLAAGQWIGDLVPMNHPDHATPLRFDIEVEDAVIRLTVVGPDSTGLEAYDVSLSADTLRYTFDEPEADVPLRCVLARADGGSFEGRCADEGGKWAHVRMRPPGGP